MTLHAPSLSMFVVSLVLAVLAIIGVFTSIPYATVYGFWVAILAYIVLAVGNLAKTWRLHKAEGYCGGLR